MRIELSILSFLSAVLIFLLSPLHWKSHNVAVLSILIWLFVVNLVQGINSTVWLGNVAVRYLVWCDIVTKLRLGFLVALAASCACLSQHLHFVSANPHTKQRFYRTLVECIICIFVPLIYMATHTIVQDHRFNLSPDFGCTSSTYTSIPAIILVWLPPLILCSVTVVYAGLALTQFFGRSVKMSDGSRVRLHSLNWAFLRPLWTTIVISVFALCSVTYSMASSIRETGGVRRWTSWSQVHANLGNVVVLNSPPELTRIEVEWWVAPVSAILFFATTVAGFLSGLEDDSMFGFTTVRRWYHARVLGRSVDIESFIHSSDNVPSFILRPSPSPHKLGSLPGWDDTIRFTHTPEILTPPPLKTTHEQPRPDSASDTESDASFMVSTLSYIQSPTGRKALGIPSPSPTQVARLKTAAAAVVNPNRLSVIDPALNQISVSPASPSQSILSASWPEPPSALPLSPINLSPLPISRSPSPRSPTSSRMKRSPSNSSTTGSMASSTAYANDYSFLPDPSDTRPFEDSAITVPSVLPSRRVKRSGSKGSFTSRTLQLGSERPSGKGKRVHELDDGVYMTVVHESS
ncbi:pheromone A receptor-domain-containing protein [Cristinia sonorae]|uniref:Pheromone A receptor-domain-containing protein n=1 Tax=Cristinia sonorae TaxID=1940300 RepID=A0A8K0UPR8_9AGAR|nr:pheromone A receptor-domain-containing protein [Cristinia sonorae]